MNGYLLIEYGRNENSYDVYFHRKDAERAFIEKAKDYAKSIGDSEVLANDEDDMEELAAGGIYSPNGEVVLEITSCNIIGEIFYPQGK
jgi:hypothetical protein